MISITENDWFIAKKIIVNLQRAFPHLAKNKQQEQLTKFYPSHFVTYEHVKKNSGNHHTIVTEALLKFKLTFSL